jgi:hypothetical protein
MSMEGEDLNQHRPYAAPANVIGVLHRVRSRNLPDTIGDDLLRLVGVPEGALYRVRGALQFLGLTDEDGRVTETLRALAGAPEDRYRELFAAVVREAYSQDFERVDPSQDTQAQIVTAFQPYQPRSQVSRMVMLFLGLCREAGIEVLDAPRERGMQSAVARPATVRARVHVGRNGSKDETPPRPQSSLPFGLTESDVEALDEAEFAEVWTALSEAYGKVVRAKVRARKAAQEPAAQEELEGTEG